MDYRVADAVEVLQRTPAVVDAMLRGKSEKWVACRISPDSFSAIDVLGHLIFGELTDWIPRTRIILEHGESRPFDEFDRYGFGSLIQGKSTEALLDQFASLRRQNLEALVALNLDREILARTGMHPGLGRVTLANHLASWVVHDLGHIAQISRIMANEYKAAVGPWTAYMSILG